MNTTAMKPVSIIVPCFNESRNVERLYGEVAGVLSDHSYEWRLILIDDGSTDDTAQRIRHLAEQDERVRGLFLSRNFGKEAAMRAGLEASQGRNAVIMDADLQHPAKLIPIMLDTLVGQCVDQVIAQRNRTGDSWIRTLLAKLYYKVANRLIDNVVLVDGAGDFRALSSRAVSAMLQLNERTRFSKGLFAWIGFPTIAIKYDNTERNDGRSSWSLKTLLNYGLDGVTSFNTKPLRLIAHLGLGLVTLGIVYVCYLLYSWSKYGVEAPGYLTLIAAIIGFSGMQLVALAALGEYVGRIFQEVKERPHYFILDDTDFD